MQVSILFLTPYFSRLILQIQLQPQEFITGLAIYSKHKSMLSIYIVLLSWCWIVLIFLKRMGGETGGILDGGEVLPRPFTSLAQDTKLFEIKII
jgi:hypothetical protein